MTPTGSDTNPGTLAAPWKTVQKALNTLTAGQSALLRAGTYAQNLTATRGGSATAPITIRNYPGERAILRPGTGATNNQPLQLASGAQYLRFSGLTFEAANGPSTTNIYAYGTSHDIEFSDCENRTSARQGFFSEKTTARIHIIGCSFHDNGGSGPIQLDHHIYIQGTNHLILNNLLHRAPNGNAIQVYPSNTGILIAGNTIDSAFREGIIIGSDGTNTTANALIINNIITNTRAAIATYWGASTGTNNIARNNLAYNTSEEAFMGTDIEFSENIVADPLYAAPDDHHLQAGSPALSRADPDYVNPTDLDRTPRPQNDAPDLGAYEN